MGHHLKNTKKIVFPSSSMREVRVQRFLEIVFSLFMGKGKALML
jgi:hypothetical protein